MNAKEIKTILKNKGIDTKNITARVSHCGYNESIYITIKNPFIRRSEVKALLQHLESYERDERTYEILEGGNTYLFVNYDDGVFEEVQKEFEEQAQKIYNRLEKMDKDQYFFIDEHLCISKELSNRYIIRETDKYTTRTFESIETLSMLLFKYYKLGSIIE